MKALILAVVLVLGMLPYAAGAVSRDIQQGEAGGKLNLSAAEIEELVSETGRQTTLMTERMADYTYTAESIERECGRGGATNRETERVYEAYPAYGRQSVRILIKENGVSRSPEQIERERKRAASELVEAEKRAAKARERLNAAPEQPPVRGFRSYGVIAGRGSGRPYKFYIRPTDFLQSHEFYAPRRSLLNGREAVLLNFRPRPGISTSDDSERVRMRLAGRLWIDAAEKVIARLEAFPLEEMGVSTGSPAALTGPDLSAPVAFELTRLPNGMWAPSVLQLNSCGREAVFEGVKVNTEDRYRGFKLFSTSVEQERLGPPQPRQIKP